MSDFAYGQMQPTDTSSELNAITFICKRLIAQMDTMKLVKVTAVAPGSGSPPAAGTVSVQPLVSQLDGQGFPVPHRVVNGIRYFRVQGGQWAVICDPAVGDVGYVICADRDSSLVAKNGGVQNPGSRRKYNIADGVYVGGVLNAVPQAYIWLKTDGTLKITDAKGNVLESTPTGFVMTPVGLGLTLNGNLIVNGALQLSGPIEAVGGGVYAGNIHTSGGVTAGSGGGDSVTLQGHTHTQGVDSHGDTEAPTSAPTAGT